MLVDWEEEDLEVLREVIAERRRLRSKRDTSAVTDLIDHEEHQTSDVYIARVPEGGFPAASDEGCRTDEGSGSGSGSGPQFEDPNDFFTVKGVEAKIYQIIRDGNDETLGKAKPVGPLKKIVYNISNVLIDKCGLVPIEKDKYGRWIVSAPGAKKKEEGSGSGSGSGDEEGSGSGQPPVCCEATFLFDVDITGVCDSGTLTLTIVKTRKKIKYMCCDDGQDGSGSGP